MRDRVHEPIVVAMDGIGYGILADGDTFYQKGNEIDPRGGITFTMRQAYVIVQALQAHEQEVRREERERIIGIYSTLIHSGIPVSVAELSLAARE